jgi:head-tail adaptor
MAELNQTLVEGISKAIEELNNKFISLDATYSKLLTNVQNANTAMNTQKANTKTLTDAEKLLNEEKKRLVAAEKESEKQAKKAAAAAEKLTVAYQKEVLEKSKATKEAKLLAAAQSAQKGSTEQLSAKVALLEFKLKGVNQETEKGKAKADAYRAAIDQANKKITEQSSALTKQKRGIGGYSEGVQDAISKSGLFSKELAILSRIQATLTALTNKQTAAQNASTAATTLGTKAMNIFKIALISTGIGAFVVALGSMIAFFKASEEGAAALQRVMSPFKILFGNIKDVVIELGGALVSAFENPKKAVSNLWTAIKTNVVNRITGLTDTFVFFGKTIESAFKLDWEGVKENSEKTGESLAQVMTGVDDAIGKTTRSLQNFAAETKKENDQNKKLADNRLALIKREREASIEQAKLEVEIQNNRLKLKDEENFTNEERLKFAELAQQQINRQAELENDLAQKRLEYRKLENSFSTSSQEDLDAEAQLEVALINVKAENAKKLLRIESEKQTIIRKINAEEIADNKIVEAARMSTVDNILEKHKEYKDEIEIIDENALDALLEQFDEEEKAAIEKDKKIAESAKEKAEKIAMITDTLGEFVGGIADNLFDKGAMQREDEIKGIEEKAEAGKISEDEAAKQIAAIKTKQAKADKKQAAFNVILSTAEAVAKIWAQTGVFAIAAQLPALAMGAARLAIVAAQPIPKFKEGTKGKFSTPDTFITSEKGAGVEWIETKTGELMQTDKPTLHTGMKGARVYSNPEVQAIVGAQTPTNDFSELIKTGKDTVKAVKNIKTFIVDSDRKIYGFKQGNYKRTYL